MKWFLICAVGYMMIVLFIWAFFYAASPRRQNKSSFDLQWKIPEQRKKPKSTSTIRR